MALKDLTLDEALIRGADLHIFRSDGGLRVARLQIRDNGGETRLVAYGEHPHLEEALVHIREDYIAGGRPYSEVYGKLHDHYLTGSSSSSTPADDWIRGGHTIDAWHDGQEFVVAARGFVHIPFPQEEAGLIWKRKMTKRWIEDSLGRVCLLVPSYFPGKNRSCAMKTLYAPPNSSPSGFLKVDHQGRGSTFEAALLATFEVGPKVDVSWRAYDTPVERMALLEKVIANLSPEQKKVWAEELESM